MAAASGFERSMDALAGGGRMAERYAQRRAAMLSVRPAEVRCSRRHTAGQHRQSCMPGHLTCTVVKSLGTWHVASASQNL